MGGEIIVGRVKYYKTTFSSHAETESEQGVAEDRDRKSVDMGNRRLGWRACIIEDSYIRCHETTAVSCYKTTVVPVVTT